jgi:Flp pilus assembly protein TadG
LRSGTPGGRPFRDEAGQTIVEFALVAPILILFIFGIIDFGFVFSNYLTVRGGTGSVARVAAVNAVPGTGSCTTVGSISANSAAKELICDAKSLIGLTQANTRVSIAYPKSCSADVLDPTDCAKQDMNDPRSTYWPGNSLVVCTQYPVSSLTGLFHLLLNGRAINEKVELRIEQQPLATQLPAGGMGFVSSGSAWVAQETPLTSWPSGCTSP